MSRLGVAGDLGRHHEADFSPTQFRQTHRAAAAVGFVRQLLLALANLEDRPRQIAVPLQCVHREVKVGIQDKHRVSKARPGSSDHKRTLSSRARSRPTTDIIVTRIVHVLSVCVTVKFRYSFTNQNPPSFTCERMSEPAPMATTSSSTFVPGMAAAIGVRMPAAAVMATVAEPVARRMAAATNHPSTSGDTGQQLTRAAMASPTPLRMRTRLNPPPAPTISSVDATGPRQSL